MRKTIRLIALVLCAWVFLPASAGATVHYNTNWAGMEALGDGQNNYYWNIQSTFTVPAITPGYCQNPQTASWWVGLGGDNTGSGYTTLGQDGVEWINGHFLGFAEVIGRGGAPLFAQTAEDAYGNPLPIASGDTVVAYTNWDTVASKFNFILTDSTQGWYKTYGVDVSANQVSGNTAETIGENDYSGGYANPKSPEVWFSQNYLNQLGGVSSHTFLDYARRRDFSTTNGSAYGDSLTTPTTLDPNGNFGVVWNHCQ